MRALFTGVCLAVGLATGCASAPPPSAPRMPSNGELARQDFATAEDFVTHGDFVRAEQYYVSALRRGHPDTQVIVKLMRVCIGASRLRAALGYAQLYLIRHPEAWALRYLTASIHLALGQPAHAQRELLGVLQSQPAHDGANRLLARLHTETAP